VTCYRFASYRLDTERVELSGPDGPIDIEPQVYGVLRHLLEAGGRLVTKEELLDEVWGDRFVSESAMTTRIKQARRVIGDDGARQWAIRTVHGRGYRFELDVTVEPDGVAATAEPGPGTETGERAEPVLRPLPPGLRPEARRPFVGRHEELAAAQTLLDGEGRRGLAWIWLPGEPGIGKTRTAAQIAARARQRGVDVLYGRCSEELSVPYQPVIEALRSVTDHLDGEALRLALGPMPRELVRLLPELPARLADLTPPDRSDPDTERYRLYEAVLGWLGRAAEDRQVMLVIDDAHWATASTVQLLRHLGDRATVAGITLVITARDTAPDESSALSDLLGLHAGSPSHVVLRLGGLDEAAVADLLAVMGGSGADGTGLDVAEALHLTAGNPLLLQTLERDDGQTVDLRRAVRRRLARLAPPVPETLTIASVIGLEFDTGLLSTVAERHELDVLDDLEEAVDAGLLTDLGTDEFRFAHALIRGSLRDEVSSGRRARLHARIGAALEARAGSAPDDVRTALAHHYGEAARAIPALRPAAVEHLRQAAARASAQLSYPDAVRYLEAARQLVDRSDRALGARLALDQGEAEMRAGYSRLALRSFEAAYGDARTIADADLLAAAAIGYEEANWRPGGSGGGPAVDRLLTARAAVPIDDRVTQMRLMTALTRAYAHAGRLDDSHATYREAAGLVGEVGDPEMEARLLNVHLAAAWDKPDVPDALPKLERLAGLLEHVDDVEVRILARQIEARHMAHCGLMDRYRAASAALQAETAALHSTFWTYVAATHHTLISLYEGRLDEAEAAADAANSLAERLVEEDTSGSYGLTMFLIRREQDRLAPLAGLVRHIVDADGGRTLWTPGLGLILAETGRWAEAGEVLDDLRRADFAFPVDAMWSTVTALVIDLAVRLGDRDACHRLHELYTDQAGKVVVTGHGVVCLGSADRFLGLLALTCGDLPVAERHLLEAAGLDEANGSPLWAGHARLGLARVRHRQGRVAEAVALSTAVGREARRRGHRYLARQAAELSQRLG